MLTKQKTKKLILFMFATTNIIGIGAVFYHFVENLSWFDAVYFSVMTLTTVGYGDIVPQTNAGKLFTAIYVVIGVGLFLGFVNILTHRVIKRSEEKEKTLKK